MAKMHGGLMAARVLKAEGVKYLFGLCGGHTNPLYDGCLAEGIKIIDTRHEQAAVHMAEGWALTTGQPGVCAFTAGPGVTNAVTGMVNASESQVPVVVFGGGCRLIQYDMHALQQEIDQLALVGSFTRWARRAYESKRIPEYVAKAFRESCGTPRGPVFLEIPWDIFSEEIEESEVKFPERYRTASVPAGDPAQIEAAAALIDKAERPVVVIGSGGFWAGASGALKAFAERTRIPVYTRHASRGMLPSDHDLSFHLSMKRALDAADLILVIGTRLDSRMKCGNFGPQAKVIWVDTNPAEIGFNHGVDVGIVGDARLALEQLTEAVNAVGSRKWVETVRKMEDSLEQFLSPLKNSDSQPVHPLRLVQEIYDFLEDGATFVHDGGDIGWLTNLMFKAYSPGYNLNYGIKFGCIGSGLPFAMAAKLARPDSQVALLTGDGTFGFNAMEFDTCVRHGINLVNVVANDGCWGMIMRLQAQKHGNRLVGTVLGDRPYHKVVEALGGYGELVKEPKDIRPALERAFASGVPACVNVQTDPSVGAMDVIASVDSAPISAD